MLEVIARLATKDIRIVNHSNNLRRHFSSQYKGAHWQGLVLCARELQVADSWQKLEPQSKQTLKHHVSF